ncbi:MAG TPA: DUF5719 family protein [Acidimicrobiales bacterium]|nr:DUF5719 family protein [Acidimicrobiales bacterium]
MTPAPRHGRGRPARPGADAGPPVWRLPVVLVVLVALVGAGLIDRAVSAPAPVAAPASSAAASVAAPSGAQSSTWFCPGGSGTTGGIANPTLYLANAGRAAVDGAVTVVNSTGSAATKPVTVPAGGQVAVSPATIQQGAWLASRVQLDGGGVTVSEVVGGSAGWSQAPCSTSTAASWYFASGATTDGDTPYVALYNPGSTAAVVDLSFVTPAGLSEPEPFQGILVPPGQVRVAGVAAYVQDQRSVGTIAAARSGRVVASELQEHVVNGVSGLSLRLGTPAPARRWYLPRTVDVTGGAAAVTILNPAKVAQRVTVRVQLKSGPVAPFTKSVPADSSWTLGLSGVARVPANTTYATTVTASGGPGVVVDRTVQSSPAGAVPQWGTVPAVAGPATTASTRWVVPSPQGAMTPPVAGVGALALDLQNVGARTVTVTVYRLTPDGPRRLAGAPVLRVPPDVFTVIETDVMAGAGTDPLLVRATGPLAVMEDDVPAGLPGAVAVAGVPQK